ncbi:hypothetical protein ACFWJW_00630 [Streptomyces sp. NPDC127097]|uniref:hypothetical protein n=1 Tax=Streptomyces sp. NPDC127097 TaxID=3347136 RepID=UPI003652CE69
MTKAKLIFADNAAQKIRALTRDHRGHVIEQLSQRVNEKPGESEYVVHVPGTEYVAVRVADRVAIARPMSESERNEFTPQADEAYFVADFISGEGVPESSSSASE